MASSPAFHVIFIGTSTPEKIRDFNIIAEHKQLAVKFFNLNQLVGTLHNTLEDGESAEENADKKLRGLKDKIEACRKNPQAVKEFCEKHGIANYAPERVWFGPEDSGITMPQQLWDNIPEEIFKVLPDEVRARLLAKGIGPEVDTAPFFSAALGINNIFGFMDAALKNFAEKTNDCVSLSQLKYKEKSVLKLQSLLPQLLDGQPIFPILTATGEVVNNYAGDPYVHPDTVGGREGTFHYVAPLSKKNPARQTAAELGVNYIGEHSARAAAVDDLVKQINYTVAPEHRLMRANGIDRYDLVTGIAKEPENFHVGVMNVTSDVNVSFEKQSSIPSHITWETAPVDEKPLIGTSDIDEATFYLSYPERVLSRSDGIVLMPDTIPGTTEPTHTHRTLEEKLYLLESIVVAKQLILRDMHKPIIIINSDHSWDDAIRIHTALARYQMTKDNTLMLSPQLPDVKVTSNAYFHIINNNNYEAALSGAQTLMKEASLTYHRVVDKNPKTEIKGESFDQRKGLVSIFCSASSENAPLNKLVSDIAYKLAEAKNGILCGGGDRYTMGAILDGVRRYRIDSKAKNPMESAFIGGISTEPIAASETDDGQISKDYNYRELAENIYVRMAKMLVPAETVIVAPGGAGTIQEWMGYNLLKQKMPHIFDKKKLIIFDPELLPDVSKNSSIQNQVFNGVLHIIFKSDTWQHYFNEKWQHYFNEPWQSHSDKGISNPYIRVATRVDDVIKECQPLKTVQKPWVQRNHEAKVVKSDEITLT